MYSDVYGSQQLSSVMHARHIESARNLFVVIASSSRFVHGNAHIGIHSVSSRIYVSKLYIARPKYRVIVLILFFGLQSIDVL
jgi:hypothetical protein